MRVRASIGAAPAIALWTVIAAFVVVPDASAATYSSASIADVSSDAQFSIADSPVVSADGQYAVFRGTVDGQTGLWRRNLTTGELDPVAVDLPGVPTTAQGYDPQAPSVSADGRYVAFNTEVPLDVANDTNPEGDWRVYVRDMDIAPGAPGAYTLASAVNGGTQSLTYGATGFGNETGSRIAGGTTILPTDDQFASPGSAISADGRTVVFTVDSQSNLVNPASVTTPPDQVAVRNLDTHTTTLVSVCEYNCGSSPTGGPVEWTDATGEQPGAVTHDDAVISADGSTVAWLSDFGALQQETVTLPNESTLYDTSGEPLDDAQAVWRRIADGPSAPTERITGEVDPSSPDCPAGAVVTSSQAPPAGCQGPLAGLQNGLQFSHLAISGDGYEVALISIAALGTGFANTGQTEAYLVDMHPGLTRDQATTALTQGVFSNASNEGGIDADGISEDGSTVALATRRTEFDLALPSYLGPPRSSAAAGDELYIMNRDSDTLDLVTYGYDGSLSAFPQGPCPTDSASLSSDGSLLVFDSCANNLVWGDGSGQSNVYAEARLAGVSSAGVGQDPVGAPPPPALTPLWVMHASARSLANGALQLFVLVPGAGHVTVHASARIQVSQAIRSRRKPRTVTRTVATGSAFAPGSGLMTLTIHIGRSYLALARRKGGLGASLKLAFAESGVGALDDTISATFHASAVKSSHKASNRRGRSGRSARGNRRQGRRR